MGKISSLNHPQNLKEEEKRRRIDYIDLIFAHVNFIIMLLASISFINYIAFSLVLLSISSLIYILFLYYWIIRNQFSIIFNYGSTICTLILYIEGKWALFYSPDAPFYILNPFVFILIIIYLFYLLTLIKTSGTKSISRKIFIRRYGGFQAYRPQEINQMWHDDAVDIYKPTIQANNYKDNIKFLEQQKKKYNIKMIFSITLISTISFIIVYIYLLAI